MFSSSRPYSYRRVRTFALSALVGVAALSPVFPQTTITSTISGSVRDPSGAGVTGAEVTTVHTATAGERRARTNEAGDFVLSSLRPGEYNLTVRAPGFKTLERKALMLTAAEWLPVGNLTLEMGTLEERVVVTAQGAAVQTVSAERSAAITSSQVDQLAMRGRSVTSLLSLLPGVVELVDPESPTGTTNFSVLGGRANTNNITLDGVTLSNPGGAPNAALTISMDAVSEVKVMLSNYQAEYGRMSGASIQMVSKSGTRDFHGLGSYYKRHEQFNSNSFFNNRNGLSKGRYRFNTWAGSVGGPVYVPGKFNRNRDKLFFFFNYEYWPQKSTSAIQTSTMPTEAERGGDFSKSLDVNGALIPVLDPATRQPFAGNILPASRMDRNGQSLLKVFPLPNFFDTSISRRTYNYATQWEDTSPTRLYTLKLDYNLGSKGSLSGTYSEQFTGGKVTNAGAGGINAPFAVVQPDRRGLGRTVSARYQYIFSPTFINELTVGDTYVMTRFTFTPEEIKRVQRGTYAFNAGQISSASNPMEILPGLAFGGIVGAAGMSYDGRFPLNNSRNTIDISDTISKIFGPHVIKAGVFIQRIGSDDGPWANNYNGTFDFGRNVNNPLDTTHPYANAAMGIFNSYTEATSRPRPLIYTRGVEWFAQDNWKVNRRLTLDVGVRFHYFEPFWTPDDKLAGFVPGRFDVAKKVQLIAPAIVNGVRVGRHPVTGVTYPASLIGAIASGTGSFTNGMVVTADDPSYPRALMESSGIITAPRLGLAYDPFGDGKTAIRAGWGMFYSRILGYAFTGVNSYPIVQTPVLQYNTIPNLRSAQGALFPPTVVAWERDMKTPYVMNLSFSIQRAIGFGTVLDAGYSGALGRHLSWERSLQDVPLGERFLPRNADPTNPRVPLPDNFLRPLTGYADIGYREAAGSSNYHSLQVTATRRFARGIEFGAAWTWSKAMDFTDGDNGRVTTLVPVRVWNYGLAGFDRTHILKANWLYTVPKRKWDAAPLRWTLNDWQVSGIASFISGAPLGIGFSQVTSTDLTGTPSLSSRIVVTGDPVLPKSERSFSQNFRTDMFRLPAVGTIGNAARTLVRGPGVNNWDIALFKSFPVRERFKMQFRCELYNAFNHTQFSGFDTTARFDATGKQVNTRFGEYTAARNPRIIQMSLRVSF